MGRRSGLLFAEKLARRMEVDAIRFQSEEVGLNGVDVMMRDDDGVFSELWIDPKVRPFVVETDLWVASGDRVERFSGANKAVGTLVLNFPDRATLETVMSDDAWYRVVTAE